MAISLTDMLGKLLNDRGKIGDDIGYFAGGKGAETSTIISKTEPQYDGDGCACWVVDSTGTFEVEIYYYGVIAGLQGNVRDWWETRGNREIHRIHGDWYVTTLAAVNSSTHEEQHMNYRRNGYLRYLTPLESRVEHYRSDNPFEHGANVNECITELSRIIDWDNSFVQFDTYFSSRDSVLDATDPFNNTGYRAWTGGTSDTEYSTGNYLSE